MDELPASNLFWWGCHCHCQCDGVKTKPTYCLWLEFDKNKKLHSHRSTIYHHHQHSCTYYNLQGFHILSQNSGLIWFNSLYPADLYPIFNIIRSINEAMNSQILKLNVGITHFIITMEIGQVINFVLFFFSTSTVWNLFVGISFTVKIIKKDDLFQRILVLVVLAPHCGQLSSEQDTALPIFIQSSQNVSCFLGSKCMNFQPSSLQRDAV